MIDIELDEYNNHHNFDLSSSITDANGKSISTPSVSMFTDDEKKESHWHIQFGTTEYQNPLHLKLFAYSNYIEGDVKVELINPSK